MTHSGWKNLNKTSHRKHIAIHPWTIQPENIYQLYYSWSSMERHSLYLKLKNKKKHCLCRRSPWRTLSALGFSDIKLFECIVQPVFYKETKKNQCLKRKEEKKSFRRSMIKFIKCISVYLNIQKKLLNFFKKKIKIL